MNDVGKITTVIEDHIQGLATSKSSKRLLNTPGVFLLGFTFPCKDRDTSRGNAVRVGKQEIVPSNMQILTRQLHDPESRRCSIVVQNVRDGNKY